MADTDRVTTALADRYAVQRELGVGGMATVYLARDLKHDREVAIKVLHPDLGAAIGGERFLSEIKTTAKLQHPHILPLLDSGTADGLLYYVMPYVRGETLRARLARERQLPIDDAVRITREVLDALGAAHAAGIVHRDVKPENILLQGGHALVADFGIALAVQSAGGARMTQTGLSLGTPQYMSPEQALGEKQVDHRADLYATGCVLYEMLAGQPPFVGATAQAVVSKLLTAEPEPVSALRKSVPPNVEGAIDKALQKVAADRFADAAHFSAALDPSTQFAAGATTASRTASTQRAHPATGFRGMLPWALAVLAAIIAAIGWLRARPSDAPMRQRVVLWHHPVSRIFEPGSTWFGVQAAIAPDGSNIVYMDSVDGALRLMRKMRGDERAVPLNGTEGGRAPFFSPDGRWVGYTAEDGKIEKIPVDGGGSVKVAERSTDLTYTAGAWLDDGTIVFAGEGGINQVSASGGPPHVIVADSGLSRRSFLTIWPLPKSRGVLYSRCPGNCSIGSEVYVYEFATKSSRLLVANAAGAWYVPPGFVLYTDRSGGLYAEGFDATTLKATSGPVPVIEDVIPMAFTVSASGAALYSTGAAGSQQSELTWVSRTGVMTPFDSAWSADFHYPALSRDGRSLAVSARDKTTQLWVRRADGTRSQLTKEGTVNWRPTWTPDGDHLVFSSNRLDPAAGEFALFEVPVSGSQPATLLLHYEFPVWEGQISPDRRWLVWRADEQSSVGQIRGRRLDGDTTVVPLVVEKLSSRQIALSPDGRWLAYSGQATGRFDIYVTPFPAVTAPRLVSRDGGTEPRWAWDGRELFFRSGPRMLAVSVNSGPPLSLGTPHVLFSSTQFRSARNRPEYDVSPDGQRFLMIRDVGGQEENVVYVENWFAELRAKVGASH